MKFNELKKNNHTWDPDTYNKSLINEGYIYPFKETSKTFVDLDGRTRYVANKPYCLIDYDNSKIYRSEFAIDVNETYKKIKPENWQIIDLNNNKVLADPNKKERK